MRHNLLLITADDMWGRTPGCTGGMPDATPTIDRLADEGMVFQRAHVPIAVCQPSRSALMTARWPHRNGAEGFEPIADDVPLLTDTLRQAGYLCGILGKVEHLQPMQRFGWDLARCRDALGVGRDPYRYAQAAQQFITAARQQRQPWFLMANAHDPHRPFHRSDQERQMFTAGQIDEIPPPSRVFGPGEVDVPGFLPDLPEVRKEIAEYQSSARRCDDVVAALLGVLDHLGEARQTVVVFLSDNGMAFPFAKANCYLQSTLTPLVVRWPGVTAPGSHDDKHLVSTLDLLPAFCAAAGADSPGQIDGRSLVPLLEGRPEPGRDHIVTTFHETAAKARFEMRAIQTTESGYIWNHWSDGARAYNAENMTGRTWPAMLTSQDQKIAARAQFYLNRTPDEFYDLSADPHGLRNLADNQHWKPDLSALQKLLLSHLHFVADPLAGAFAQHLAAAQ